MADAPIQVNPAQLPAMAATLLRYILTALGAYMAKQGLLPAGSDVNAIVGFALMVISGGWGIWKTYSNKTKLVTAASAAPDDVAVVKGS